MPLSKRANLHCIRSGEDEVWVVRTERYTAVGRDFSTQLAPYPYPSLKTVPRAS